MPTLRAPTSPAYDRAAFQRGIARKTAVAAQGAAHVRITARNGPPIFGSGYLLHGDGTVSLVPWGCASPLRLDLREVARVDVAVGVSAARVHVIQREQRARLDAPWWSK